MVIMVKVVMVKMVMVYLLNDDGDYRDDGDDSGDGGGDCTVVGDDGDGG